MNWFIFVVGILQAAGATTYLIQDKAKFAILMYLYSATNFVIFWMKGE